MGKKNQRYCIRVNPKKDNQWQIWDRKIANTKTGQKYSKKHGIAVSKALKGRKLSLEHKKAIADGRRKKIFDKYSQIIIKSWNKLGSIRKVAIDTGICRPTIKIVLQKFDIKYSRKNQYG